MRKIVEGKVTKDDPAYLKGLFSLGTHTMIEIEQGNSEYRCVLPTILEKISDIIYRS